MAGPPGDRRLAHAPFPGRALAAAERSGATAVGAFGQPRSVVGGEDHEGILFEALRAERVEHLTDAPIDFLNPIAEATVLGFAREGRAGIDRRVDGVVGEVEVEGLVLIATDEVDRFLGIELDHAALTFPVHQLGDLLISQERDDRDLGVGALLEHIIGVRNAQVVVEALAGGQELGLIAEVPLADHLGGVAFFFKSLGYSYFSRIKPDRLTREIDPGDRDAGAVAAGHHLGAGNRADRGGVEASQLHPLLGHPVQVRGALLGRPIGSDVPVTHIIDKDHHHVGRTG